MKKSHNEVRYSVRVLRFDIPIRATVDLFQVCGMFITHRIYLFCLQNDRSDNLFSFATTRKTENAQTKVRAAVLLMTEKGKEK